MIQEGDKLYVITREDMKSGYIAVQSIHAAIEFCYEHKDVCKEWHLNSNYLALLSAKSENHLQQILQKAEMNGILYSVFREPDIGNQITSIVLEPKAKKICSNLPLALE